MESEEILHRAKALIRAEGEVISQVADQLGDAFVQSVRLVSECNSRVLVTGAGTSGIVARRLAHLLASCAVPAFYIHPAEALHGPSAAVSDGDVIIAISKAGKSTELNQFVAVGQQRGAKTISWTWEPDSELARLSDVVVVIRPDVKGEGEGVLPFGSSLANGAVGDALCLVVRRLRNFELSELAQTHPAGATAQLVQTLEKKESIQ